MKEIKEQLSGRRAQNPSVKAIVVVANKRCVIKRIGCLLLTCLTALNTDLVSVSEKLKNTTNNNMSNFQLKVNPIFLFCAASVATLEETRTNVNNKYIYEPKIDNEFFEENIYPDKHYSYNQFPEKDYHGFNGYEEENVNPLYHYAVQKPQNFGYINENNQGLKNTYPELENASNSNINDLKEQTQKVTKMMMEQIKKNKKESSKLENDPIYQAVENKILENEATTRKLMRSSMTAISLFFFTVLYSFFVTNSIIAFPLIITLPLISVALAIAGSFSSAASEKYEEQKQFMIWSREKMDKNEKMEESYKQMENNKDFLNLKKLLHYVDQNADTIFPTNQAKEKSIQESEKIIIDDKLL